MHESLVARQRRQRLPISSPMGVEEVELIDRAATIREESRAQFIRRAALADARSILRRAERDADRSAA